MTDFDSGNELPEELRGVSDRLRENRPSFTPLELDQIKLRALNQAESGKRRRRPLVSRWVTLGLATVVLGGTAATGFASGGSFFGHGQNAAWSQYQPGHPCKPRDHFPWAYGFNGFSHCKPMPRPPKGYRPNPPKGHEPNPPKHQGPSGHSHH